MDTNCLKDHRHQLFEIPTTLFERHKLFERLRTQTVRQRTQTVWKTMDTNCLKDHGHQLFKVPRTLFERHKLFERPRTQTVWKTKDTNSLKDKLFERPRMQTVWNRESQAEETKVYRDYSRHLPQLLLWIGIFDLWAVDNVGLSRLDLAHWRVGYITNSGPIIKCLWLISVVWHWKGHYGAKVWHTVYICKNI